MTSVPTTKRCQLCAKSWPYWSSSLKAFDSEANGKLPVSLQAEADAQWLQKTEGLCTSTFGVCSGRCLKRVHKAFLPKSHGKAKRTRARDDDGFVRIPKKQYRLTAAARGRFEMVSPNSMDDGSGVPMALQPLALRTASVLHRPLDSAVRSRVWSELLFEEQAAEPSSSSTAAQTDLVWEETVAGMKPGVDLGPPLLIGSRLATGDRKLDGYDDTRALLRKCARPNAPLHEIKVEGHALNQIDINQCVISTMLCIDEEVTKYRNELQDTQEGSFRQKYGWADPDSDSCTLLVHPTDAPLLVIQQHEHVRHAIAGEDGAPVLMYAPSLLDLLREGHPGRVALFSLRHPSADESWLQCRPLGIPPDHIMHGWTLNEILAALPEGDKPAGHGHGFERLVASGDSGGSVSQCWVPSNRLGRDDINRVRRPLVGHQSVLEFDDASSAIQ